MVCWLFCVGTLIGNKYIVFISVTGLEGEFESLIADSLSTKSAAIYEKCFDDYSNFCEEMSLPIAGGQSKVSVELWVAQLVKKGLGYGTVQSHLSALRHMFRRKGIKIAWESEKLGIALKGLKKRRQQTLRKHPVSLSQIKSLYRGAEVTLPVYSCQMFKVMISFAFFGFLRPSEFCVSSEDHYLRCNDVKISKSRKALFLRLRSFKHSEKPTIITISDSWFKSLSIVEQFKGYWEKQECRPEDEPLFNITVAAFRSMLQKVCSAAGMKVKITPHCFRHGGATWASKRGWSVARIKAHGRWKSQAYNTYISA